MVDNSVILGYVKDINVAKVQSCANAANESNGKDVSSFMKQIYDKLSELNKTESK